jgi:hypothetical protein
MSNSKTQKIQKTTTELSAYQEVATRLGALAFTGLAVVGATEMILEHMQSLNPAVGHGSSSLTELFARGEGKGESARMPEEFDIGLQTPHVSGL